MYRNDFYSGLARVTGESVRTLRRRGFSLLEQDSRHLDRESVDVPPRTVDWDEVEAERIALAIQA
jgi:hypothetical protein